MELCLGTAQFGMKYGVQGSDRPTLDSAIKMLDYATQNEVKAIDTATAYGEAEFVVGAFLAKKTVNRNNLEIVSKFPPNGLDGVLEKSYREIIRKNLFKTLTSLKTDYIDGYLYHSSEYAENLEAVSCLQEFVKEGYIKAGGVSVYSSENAKSAVKNGAKLLQFAYSLFDQRMQEAGIFDEALKNNVMVDVRSIYLQGLLLMKSNCVPSYLSEAVPLLRELDCQCQSIGYTRQEVAMGFVKSHPSINRIVVGADTLQQLKETVEAFNQNIPLSQIENIGTIFREVPEKIVMPSLWNRGK